MPLKQLSHTRSTQIVTAKVGRLARHASKRAQTARNRRLPLRRLVRLFVVGAVVGLPVPWNRGSVYIKLSVPCGALRCTSSGPHKDSQHRSSPSDGHLRSAKPHKRGHLSLGSCRGPRWHGVGKGAQRSSYPLIGNTLEPFRGGRRSPSTRTHTHGT